MSFFLDANIQIRMIFATPIHSLNHPATMPWTATPPGRMGMTTAKNSAGIWDQYYKTFLSQMTLPAIMTSFLFVI